MNHKTFITFVLIIVIVNVNIIINVNQICSQKDWFQICFSFLFQIIILYFSWNLDNTREIFSFFLNNEPADFFKVYCGFLILLLLSFWFLWGGITGVTLFGGSLYCDV